MRDFFWGGGEAAADGQVSGMYRKFSRLYRARPRDYRLGASAGGARIFYTYLRPDHLQLPIYVVYSVEFNEIKRKIYYVDSGETLLSEVSILDGEAAMPLSSYCLPSTPR